MYDHFLADLAATGPILLVAFAGVAVVLIDSFRNDSPAIPWISAAAMVGAAAWTSAWLGTAGVAFNGQVLVGGVAGFATLVVLVGAVLSLVLSVPYLTRIRHNYGEVHGLILIATAGMMTLVSSGSLVTLFVGLETMSICLYVLTGLVRAETTANESALKYFLLGSFSTGFFLYGIALMYGATGTMLFSEMAPGLTETGRPALFGVGVALLLIGFLFKVSAVPFHQWTPDVYQGAPTSLTAFMSTASKTAAFAALAVVLGRAVPAELIGGGGPVQVALAVVAAVTMVFGNVAALTQSNVKRMLAYSSVAHAGYILAGLATGTAAGTSAALFYLLAYTVMNVGAFGVMGALEWDNREGAEQTLASLAGMGYRRPLLGVAMGVFMFALTGFPPLGGFIGKYLVFSAVVQSGMTWLAVIGVLASVVSAVYYLRVLTTLWMRSASEGSEGAQAATFLPSRATTSVVAICALALLLLGIVPSGVISLARTAVEGSAAFALLP
ncbi:MAG TPA: NADH-quinone oxidoreductase subunit N [Rubricoccaceae bacterium]|jgi:NADH-quinone oxidoreductase subunit N